MERTHRNLYSGINASSWRSHLSMWRPESVFPHTHCVWQDKRSEYEVMHAAVGTVIQCGGRWNTSKM